MSINISVRPQLSQLTSFQSWMNQQAQYIIKPVTARGISGFVFSIRDEEQIALRAEVTDYVMEDNSAKQDHIALKPMQITLRGFVGEVVNQAAPGVPQALSTIQSRLTSVNNYFPPQTQWGIQALNSAINFVGTTIASIDDYINQTQNLVSDFESPLETAQQRAFNALKSMWSSRQVITVETPWGYFDSMAIMDISPTQDGKTAIYSDFSVTLKQMQFAKVINATINSDGRAQEMISDIVDKGLTQGTLIDSSSNLFQAMAPSTSKGIMNYMLNPAGSASNLQVV